MTMAEPTYTRRFGKQRIHRRQAEVRAFGTNINVVRPAADNSSRQLEYTDEFESPGFVGIVLKTPYSIPQLFQVLDKSNMLKQCIDAYVTNTVMSGWEVGDTIRGSKADQYERDELQSFISHANSEQSLMTVMADVIRDRESVGFGFLEVIRDASRGISLLRHVKSLYTRLTKKHRDEVLVEYTIVRGKRNITGSEWRRFRRFVQQRNGLTVYFKEFGDPRRMDWRTGIFENESGYVADPAFEATEIVHFPLPSNESYGVPRWISHVASALGSREAEEFNLRYFQENTVPPMMLLVSGGRLTQESFRGLQEMIQQGAGAERQNRMQIVEAVGETDSLDGKPTGVTIEVEKLSTARQSDALFGEYDTANQAKQRSAWRLPAVSVGMANEHNFATAQVAAATAESQVFAPGRFEIDERLNNVLVQSRRGLDIRTACLVSRTPSITSPDMVVKTLTAINAMGAVTPRSAQTIVNKMLQLELPEYPKKGDADYEPWMDQPIVFVTSKAKNPDGSTPEPGDQFDEMNTPPPSADGSEADPGKLPGTHAGQGTKAPAIKKGEKTGAVAPAAPEHGQE